MKILGILLTVIMIIAAVPGISEQIGPVTVGASYQTLNNAFYTTLSDSIERYVQLHGGIYIAMDAQVNLQKQTSDVEDLIQLGCDIIIIAPIDSNGSVSAVRACQDADVPVICVNSGVNYDYAAATIETDNYLAGIMMAKALVQLTGGVAKVGMLEYSLNDAGRGRSDGFMDTVASYPDIEIIARQECDTTTETALPIAEDMLQANTELTAFFSINDPTAYGIYSAAVGLDKADDIVIVSCDGGSDVLDWVRSGRIRATVAQLPWQMGSLAAKTAYDLLEGKSVDKYTLVSPVILTTENIQNYESFFSEEGFIWPETE